LKHFFILAKPVDFNALIFGGQSTSPSEHRYHDTQPFWRVLFRAYHLLTLAEQRNQVPGVGIYLDLDLKHLSFPVLPTQHRESDLLHSEE
jgi:hypothetical protein